MIRVLLSPPLLEVFHSSKKKIEYKGKGIERNWRLTVRNSNEGPAQSDKSGCYDPHIDVLPTL